jgi:phosphate-selective porin OprO/OprP
LCAGTSFARLAILGAAFLAGVVIFPGRATGQDARADILILNATLADPAGVADDRSVNIVIRDGLLSLITEGPVAADDFPNVVDANSGFALGTLDVGSPANFMILSADPRENFRVLLDTKQYAAFAMHDGTVVKNELLLAVEPEPEAPSSRGSWLAYTPPPMAVPLSYTDTEKWNRFETKYISGLFTAGMVLDRTNWLSQDADSESQVGDLAALEGGTVRGFRLGLVGTLNAFETPWVYTVFGATNAFDKGFNEDRLDDFTLFDWRLDIPLFEQSTLSIGKQKEPISGERVQSMIYNHMQERSAVSDAMLPARNVGIVLNGGNASRYITWAVGVFNDWFDANQDLDESSTQLIGRVTWAPLRTADDSSLLHLALGYRYSDAKEGFRYFTEPEFNSAPIYVDTGFGTATGALPADRLSTYNAELAWRRGPLWIAAEYTRSDVSNNDLGDPAFDGYWVGVSWALTGEMRPYNAKSGTFRGQPVAQSVYQGGRGAWEVSARWSTLDLTDGLVDGGELDTASLGLTWWLTPVFSVSADYRYIWNTRLGLEGTSSGLNTRLLLLLE